ncbi:MAG: HEAT repeat domain-containing protein [Acidobacteriota bacterium]
MERVEGLIEELEEQFQQLPSEGLRQLKSLVHESPLSFAEQAAGYLAQGKDSRFTRLIVQELQEQSAAFEKALFDSLALPVAEIERVAALVANIEPRILVGWTNGLQRELIDTTGNDPVQPILRRMVAISAAVDAPRMRAVMSTACEHSDVRVRAKAVALVNRAVAEDQEPAGLNDSDARVRATAVETLWGRTDALAIGIFERHARSETPREAINAVIGLHRAGSLEARKLLMDWSEAKDGRFDRSAVWAMGQSDDPRLLAYLQQRVRVVDSSLRGHVLRSLKRLRDFQEAAHNGKQVHIRKLGVEQLGLGRVRIQAGLTDEAGRPFSLKDVRPNHFLVEDRRGIVENCQVRFTGSDKPIDYLLLLPAQTQELIQDKLEELLANKRREDFVSIQRYPGGTSGTHLVTSTVEFAQNMDGLMGLARTHRVAGKDWEEAMDRCFGSFPPKEGRRHLLFVSDPDWGTDEAPSPEWAARLNRLGITFHFLARHRARPAIVLAWKRLCHTSGGSYVECPFNVNLPSSLQRFMHEIVSGVELICTREEALNDAPPARQELRIELLARGRWGRIEINPFDLA